MDTESNQFFQFDRVGNMYVFAPGAGATGPSKLVKPGDELIFNPSYNHADWVTDEWPVTEDTGAIANTCLPAGTSTRCDFKPPLSKEVLVKLGHKNFSAETMKQVCWVCKVYREWKVHYQALGLEKIVCDLEDKATITAETLKFALCHFITKVKKLDGTNYPGKTLYHSVICIQFHLKCLGFAFKLVNDPAFKDLKYTSDNTLKAHTSQGIGISVKQAEILTATDKDLLWSLGCLGMSHPQQLLNTVIFSIGKGFAL